MGDRSLGWKSQPNAVRGASSRSLSTIECAYRNFRGHHRGIQIAPNSDADLTPSTRRGSRRTPLSAGGGYRSKLLARS
jgi:hypothetical protein